MNFHTEQVCLFVCSSQNTFDVFQRVSPSFKIHWPHCPYKKFVGLNTGIETENLGDWTPITAPIDTWKSELLQQLTQLPAQYKFILLFLDDFLLTDPVDEKKLETLVHSTITKNLDYLRLVPRCFAFFPKLFHQLKQSMRRENVELINIQEPYYSSLQVCLWKRDHLIDTLHLKTKNIWDFEHQRLNGIKHHAVVGKSPIPYTHVVEKGKWKPYARRVFKKLGLPYSAGMRLEQGFMSRLKLWFDLLKFEVVGYGWVKLKRRWQS